MVRMLVFIVAGCTSLAVGGIRVGATVEDVTPTEFPVIVNGGFLSRSVSSVNTTLSARTIVVDDGERKLAIITVDSCMMPRPFLDDVKGAIEEKFGILISHQLISATHTHSAPSCMGALGTGPDPRYPSFLKHKLVKSVEAALANLEPAKVGWGSADAPDHTALRRWIRRPDKVDLDPFGNRTVRATMHAGRIWDNVVGESGPEDPELSMISFQSLKGRPIAVLANFSMHYFGDKALSADYFGLFGDGMKARLAKREDGLEGPSFVGVLSHGCSGDIWRRDYKVPDPRPMDKHTIQTYTDTLLDIAMGAYEKIEYRADVDLAVAESRPTLKYRVPDQQRLEWAQRIVEAMGDRLPKSKEEVYAREQIILHERQETQIVLQGMRIGDIGIATTPNETYAITGLKVKLQSPLVGRTMVIELANGGDGYIPPPEQHLFGGYNTWAARSAGLEVLAEPKITETALQLLEEVAGRSRQAYRQGTGPACKAVLDAKPVAYWRLDELAGPRAKDVSGNELDGMFEESVTYFLDGPRSHAFVADQPNRCTHFVGGRLNARLARVGDTYSVSLWCWNGMPVEGRGVTGWMFSRGRDFGLARIGDHLGIGGADGHAGKLIFLAGNDPSTIIGGKTLGERWTWNHVVLIRDGQRVRVYLNGELEIDSRISGPSVGSVDQMFFGGRCDRTDGWEGRLDEIAVFDRVLSEAEAKALFVE